MKKEKIKMLCLSLSKKDFKELNEFLELSGNKNQSFIEIAKRAIDKNDYLADSKDSKEKANFRISETLHKELTKKATSLNVSVSRLIAKYLNES